VSAENVELVRSLQLGPEVDVVSFVSVGDPPDERQGALERLFDPAVECTMRLPGMAPVAYLGLEGLRDAWRDWLKHWASYRVETEDVIDGGERVVVVHRSRGRPGSDAAEVTRRRATIWTLRDNLVTSVHFNVPYAEALAAIGLAGSPDGAGRGSRLAPEAAPGGS